MYNIKYAINGTYLFEKKKNNFVYSKKNPPYNIPYGIKNYVTNSILPLSKIEKAIYVEKAEIKYYMSKVPFCTEEQKFIYLAALKHFKIIPKVIPYYNHQHNYHVCKTQQKEINKKLKVQHEYDRMVKHLLDIKRIPNKNDIQ